MNTGTLWGLCIGGAVLGLIFLIGITAILIQYCVRRFRKTVWSEITSPPVSGDATEKSRWSWSRSLRRSGTDREPIVNPQNDVIIDIPNDHVAIPIEENSIRRDLLTDERPTKALAQIQRERLDRIKSEARHLRPMIDVNDVEVQLKEAIDQIQKDFDESF